MLRFQEVIRKVRLPRRPDSEENDAEHSYQLAMMAWYLNSSNHIGMSTDLLLKYSLVHDIAELYAGDVHVLDRNGREGKKQREAESLAKIAKELPEFPDLVNLVHEYEAQENDESRFVYALDKVMPMLMVYMEGGSTWRELDYGMEDILQNKRDTTKNSPAIKELNEQIESMIRQSPGLFPAEK
jgi:putative hydrolase of HD superfamily